jgi:hypothetical protein
VQNSVVEATQMEQAQDSSASFVAAIAAATFSPEDQEGVRIVTRLVDWKYNIESSVFVPRLHHSDAKVSSQWAALRQKMFE